MKKYLIEFLGTFFLILVIAFTGNPLAIGLALAALVYMGGYISGAHYNPAVTFALVLTKTIDSYTALKYMGAQMLGGIAASGIFFFIRGTTFIPAPQQNTPLLSALTLEILFTFLLVSVVLHVAATEKTKGNDYYGLAIGLTVLAGAYAAGPLSGGVFNPAVGISPLLFDLSNIANHTYSLFLYLAGPLIGGGLASIVYKIK